MAGALELPAKENRRGKGIRSCLPSPTPAQLSDGYRLVLVYVFDSVVILCTCETDPALHETSLFKDHLPTIFGYQQPGFWHWTWSTFLIEHSGKGHSRKERQLADAGFEIGENFKTNIWRVLFTCLFFPPHPGFHWAFATLRTRHTLDWFVPHQLCWCCTNCLNSPRLYELMKHFLGRVFVIFKWSLKDAYIWVICRLKMLFNLNCLNW